MSVRAEEAAMSKNALSWLMRISHVARRLEYKNKDTKPTWRVPWSKGHSINNIQEVRFVSIEVRRYMYVILYIYMGITLASKIEHA